MVLRIGLMLLLKVGVNESLSSLSVWVFLQVLYDLIEFKAAKIFLYWSVLVLLNHLFFGSVLFLLFRSMLGIQLYLCCFDRIMIPAIL